VEDDQRFREVLREQAEQARHRLGSAPTPAEVLDFVEGKLEGADRERVADGIAAFPEAGRLARDLARFPEVELDEGAEPPGEAEIASAWQRIRAADRRLRPAPPGPARSGVPPRRWSRRSLAAAAALVAAVLGFAGGHRWVEERPRANPEVRTLAPRSAGGPRGVEALGFGVPVESASLILILPFVGAAEEGSYELTVLEQGGRVLWATDDLWPREDGAFTVEIPRGFLAPGHYVLELRSAVEAGPSPLETYDLVLEAAPPGGAESAPGGAG
jgi:hypothetical protein